jgi:hypothetical protein
MTDSEQPVRPTAAGIYDFFLGGTAHTVADRTVAARIVEASTDASDAAWANRGFLQRAVKRMAWEWGVRQFLDIGSGLPTQRNTHDVLAEVAPDSHVVYVDIDPVVVARSQAMLSGLTGVTAIQGDIRKPEAILRHPETRRLIDFGSPVGLLLVAVLHFVSDDDDPWSLVERYVAEVPSGSYLALSHTAVGEQLSAEEVKQGAEFYRTNTDASWTDRTWTEIERFFHGLVIVPPYQGAEPRLAHAGLWGADDPAAADSDGSRLICAAVARKP